MGRRLAFAMKNWICLLVILFWFAGFFPSSAKDLKSNHALIVLPKVPKFSAGHTWQQDRIHDDPYTKMMKALQTRISRNWEPGMDIGDKRVVFSFGIQDDCKFSNVNLVRTSGDDQFDFAAKEALEEANKFLSRRPLWEEDMRVQFTFSKNVRSDEHGCIADLLKKYPELQLRKSKILHLIPLDAMQSAEGVDETLVHSSNNLKIVRDAYVDSEELKDLRYDWVEFLRTAHITNSVLKDQAKRLELKYSFIFEPIPKK